MTAAASDAVEFFNGRGADLVIEVTNSPFGFATAAEAVRIGGRVVGTVQHMLTSGITFLLHHHHHHHLLHSPPPPPPPLTTAHSPQVLVGIPDGNEYTLDASLIRRKGLDIKTSRRMGDVYPRAIEVQ
jgi:L-iditol 2-dehydrogenase